MKLGIKTTDGVTRLKIKTTDGVVKAVECACCKCDPYALWGPGYDDQPSEIQVLGFTLWRVNNCSWQAATCGNCGPGEFEAPFCPDGCDQFEITFLSLNTGIIDGLPNEPFLSFGKLMWIDNRREYVSFIATRTGGEHPAPYGIYSIEEIDVAPEYNLGDTITISPPP
jgi:hypothetical protein